MTFKRKSKPKPWVMAAAAVVAVIVILILIFRGRESQPEESYTYIEPAIGDIMTSISVTGTVLPKNRLEIKPPVNGRIESILVVEGQKVRKDQVLAYMSSTERSALIDAAKTEGAAALKYWQKVYQPISIVTPINGEVIVRDAEPGQTITTTSTILVISDRLLVDAEVDETDIGRVKIGQTAVISLDAHPEVEVQGKVSHISFESKTVNNVTIYVVEVQPNTIPELFRSGMTANIKIVENMKKDALLVPLRAVTIDGGKYFVKLAAGKGQKNKSREITVGISDDESIEVLSGTGKNDKLAIVNNKIGTGEKSKGSTNPFLPKPPRK